MVALPGRENQRSWVLSCYDLLRIKGVNLKQPETALRGEPDNS